jgi:aryl-alcohol dehydrogenase-like predicted oxidoreductase
MQARELGNTGIHVSRLGLGLAALGRPGYINIGHAADLRGEYDETAMEHRTHRVLDKAWASGIRYFDVARSYGKGEGFLGSWLRTRGILPEDVLVASKWGYTYTADWQVKTSQHEVKEHSLAALQRQWRKSERQFGQHLDLYQIHSATFESGVLDNKEILRELARLKSEAGVLIGLTLSGPKQGAILDAALRVRVDGDRLFDCVQATWNLLEPSAAYMLAQAHEAGMGVVIKEALANGRLTSRNDDPDLADGMVVLRAEAQRLGASVDAVAVAAVLAQPWVDVVLSGATTVDQLESNVRALGVVLDERAVAALKGLAEPAEAYWYKRANLPWN